MKRIILALATIITSAGLTAAASANAWSDTATATDIVVNSGSADLRVSANHGSTFSTTSANSPYNISDLVPGVIKEEYAFSLKQEVSEDNTSKMTLKGKIVSSTITPVTDPLPAKSDIKIQVYQVGGPDSSAWYSLSEWESTTDGLPLGSELNAPNRVKEYGIRVKFVNNPDGNWQDKTLKFNLEVTGTQEGTEI